MEKMDHPLTFSAELASYSLAGLAAREERALRLKRQAARCARIGAAKSAAKAPAAQRRGCDIAGSGVSARLAVRQLGRPGVKASSGGTV